MAKFKHHRGSASRTSERKMSLVQEESLLLTQQSVEGLASITSKTLPGRTIGQKLLTKLASGPYCGPMSALYSELGCSYLPLYYVKRELAGEDRIVAARCPADRRRVVLSLPGSTGCGHLRPQPRHGLVILRKEELR